VGVEPAQFPGRGGGRSCSSARANAQQLTCALGYAAGDTIQSLAITPDGRTLVSSDNSAWLRFWRLPEGAYYMNRYGHSLAISPDGRFLASVNVLDRIALLSLPEGLIYKAWQSDGDAVLAITPDSRLLVSEAAVQGQPLSSCGPCRADSCSLSLRVTRTL